MTGVKESPTPSPGDNSLLLLLPPGLPPPPRGLAVHPRLQRADGAGYDDHGHAHLPAEAELPQPGDRHLRVPSVVRLLPLLTPACRPLVFGAEAACGGEGEPRGGLLC